MVMHFVALSLFGLRVLDVGSLLAFWAFSDVELHFLTFFERFEAVHLDSGEMGEQVLAAAIRSDEAETF